MKKQAKPFDPCSRCISQCKMKKIKEQLWIYSINRWLRILFRVGKLASAKVYTLGFLHFYENKWTILKTNLRYVLERWNTNVQRSNDARKTMDAGLPLDGVVGDALYAEFLRVQRLNTLSYENTSNAQPNGPNSDVCSQSQFKRDFLVSSFYASFEADISPCRYQLIFICSSMPFIVYWWGCRTCLTLRSGRRRRFHWLYGHSHSFLWSRFRRCLLPRWVACSLYVVSNEIQSM